MATTVETVETRMDLLSSTAVSDDLISDEEGNDEEGLSGL